MVADVAGQQPTVGRRMSPVKFREWSAGIQQGHQIGPVLLGQMRGPMLPGTAGTEATAFPGAERESPTHSQGKPVDGARFYGRSEAEHAHQLPEEPEPECLHLGKGRRRELLE